MFQKVNRKNSRLWKAVLLWPAVAAGIVVGGANLSPAQAAGPDVAPMNTPWVPPSSTGTTVPTAPTTPPGPTSAGPTPTTSACDPQWSTATPATPSAYEVSVPTITRFVYSAPAGAGCTAAPAYATTTVTVFTDAAGTRTAGRATTGAGATAGSVRVTGLSPGVDYYYSVQASNTSPHGGVIGPVRTPAGPTATPTFPPDICQLFANGKLRTATSASLSFDYTYGGAGVCNLSSRLRIFTDAAGQNLVRTLDTPTGADAGAIEVTGLTPDTAYYYSFYGSYLAPGTIQGPVRTLATGPTGTSTAPTARCTATFQVKSDWRQGFLAEVTITNPGPRAVSGWTVDWAWTNGEHLNEAYSAKAGGTADHPTLSPESWNSRLAAGRSTSVFVLGSGQASGQAPVLNCTPA